MSTWIYRYKTPDGILHITPNREEATNALHLPCHPMVFGSMVKETPITPEDDLTFDIKKPPKLELIKE